MTRPARFLLPLFAVLSACATVPAAEPSQSRPQQPGVRITPPQTPIGKVPSVPGVEIMNLAGLETVIGATASQLSSQFGLADLDVAEGDARKLQYRGEACVLEFYLYPAQNGVSVTTWVEARRTSDGLDVDRAACVGALRQ